MTPNPTGPHLMCDDKKMVKSKGKKGAKPNPFAEKMAEKKAKTKDKAKKK